MNPQSSQQPQARTPQARTPQTASPAVVVVIVLVVVGLIWWGISAYHNAIPGEVPGTTSNGVTTYSHTGSGYTARYTPNGLYVIQWQCSGAEDMLVNVKNVASGNIEAQWNATCNYNGSQIIAPSLPGAQYYLDIITTASWTISIVSP